LFKQRFRSPSRFFINWYKTSFIKKARRVRKVFGGGMRQAGFLAAAGIYALDHNINRLKEDHARAKN
jgi:threonine aldolase